MDWDSNSDQLVIDFSRKKNYVQKHSDTLTLKFGLHAVLIKNRTKTGLVIKFYEGIPAFDLSSFSSKEPVSCYGLLQEELLCYAPILPLLSNRLS